MLFWYQFADGRGLVGRGMGRWVVEICRRFVGVVLSRSPYKICVWEAS